jgi:hypothetical protein
MTQIQTEEHEDPTAQNDATSAISEMAVEILTNNKYVFDEEEDV